MKQILIYSDSLTWGIIPNTRNRLSFYDRWSGVFENALLKEGKDVRIIENCLNGRRTVWDDPFKIGRNGSELLSCVIEMHSPLKLVIIMLGTNDFQATHQNNIYLCSQGIVKLINIIKQSPIEPNMPIPKILVISPPEITKPKGNIAHKFEGAENRSIELASEIEKVVKELSVYYFDSNTVITASKIDGIHLDKPEHTILGNAIAKEVLKLNIMD